MKTAKQLIAQLGINEQHAVKLLNQRARYALQRDRTKVYASTPLGSIPCRVDNRLLDMHTINADLITLRVAGMDIAQMPNRTRDYVASWCRLNHLKA